MNFPITPMSARGLALQVLLECRKKEAFVQELLDQKFRQSSLSLPDRRLATQLVYGVLRRRGTLDALLRPRVSREPHQVEPWIWEILRLGAFQLLLLNNIPAHAALNESVELAQFMNQPRAKGFINAVLRSLLPLLTQDPTSACGPDALPLTEGVFRKLGQPVFPDPTSAPIEYLAQAFSLPNWLASRWFERYGWKECKRLGFWFAGPGPLTLRINSLRCERDLFMEKIEEISSPGNHPQALRLLSHLSVTDIPGFAEGHFVVQDDSAMRVASALAPEPGQHILDLCAAPGGKTTHLAELMGNRGRILACDVDERKLQPLKDTCLRLGLTNIETKALDTRHNEEAPAGFFDAVLADVPCSNTGVLGRRPEVRWRLKPSDLGHLANLQARLLNQGCERVRPGGKIVYSTCSIEPEENQMVVQGLLRTRQDFNLEAEETNIPGCPADGGYWARLRRIG
jgi:16S rRNA (cytosine967-C5)-methyltransferase